ncbi:MAG: pseudouridine synthase [Verrucomicrobia bacterium]|nr:pseudouridine synthase [Verrucomicrobiota bacterium]
MAKSNEFVGFPEGILRRKPIRLPVLANESNWFSLNKFAGLLGQAHPWYAEQRDITSAIRSQVEFEKGELKRLEIGSIFYICGPEPEVAGPMLFAKDKQTSYVLKNALGSDLITFKYWFVTHGKVAESEEICQLPVAAHKSEPRALVSHKSGKKSCTKFRKLRDSQDLSLWEATTNHPRMHQVRLHASEIGIPVYGDANYGSRYPVSTIKEVWQGRKQIPRFSGLGMVLTELDISEVLPETLPLSGKLPKSLSVLMRKYGLVGWGII